MGKYLGLILCIGKLVFTILSFELDKRIQTSLVLLYIDIPKNISKKNNSSAFLKARKGYLFLPTFLPILSFFNAWHVVLLHCLQKYVYKCKTRTFSETF